MAIFLMTVKNFGRAQGSRVAIGLCSNAKVEYLLAGAGRNSPMKGCARRGWIFGLSVEAAARVESGWGRR